MNDLPIVLVGDTFKATFISSGSVATSIIASVIDGTETVVSSGTGTNSGDGHYYRNFSGGVNTPGYYVLQWQATINGLPYKRRKRFKAVINEVD